MDASDRPIPPLGLTTNIAVVAGVSSRFVEAFRDLGLRCVADLLRHLPLRYELELAEEPIAHAAARVPPAQSVTVAGEIISSRAVQGRKRRHEATLADETGTCRITWFNTPWLRDRLHPGLRLRVWGRATLHNDGLQLVNPRYETLEGDLSASRRDERLRPIYPGSETLPSWRIENVLDGILDEALGLLDDHLHEEYRRQRELPPLSEAYRMVHRPENLPEAEQGRRRLVFDELLVMQIAVMLKRRHRRETLVAVPLRHDEAIDRRILGRFPFTLTEGQRKAVGQIAEDLQRSVPMNRLLQGDVGAGKTVVALYGLLMAVASGHQGAIMAPTELLAEQHFTSIRRMLAGAQVTIELLSGSQTAGRRREVLAALASGDIDLIVGTHALLTEAVRFKSLVLTVIDEQHRFGVHQRATMRYKSRKPERVPHTLVMTATPIPRTLSLAIFGDLDVSTIHDRPPGRQPIETVVLPMARREAVYEALSRRLAAGEQAYIVVPVIEGSGAALTDVTSHLAWLERGPLHGRRLAAMHGRMSTDERERIMDRFRDGDLDGLVATTVIEVGVDVPNATNMVIEHADRFGLAQLHQLRGRVGRSTDTSRCVLLADPVTGEAKARLSAIGSTNDGFVIAEQDLAIRGPGEVFGARQSGMAPFFIASLPRDMELLRLARRDAEAWIEANPTLDGERDALLRRRLLKAHGAALGLSDVG